MYDEEKFYDEELADKVQEILDLCVKKEIPVLMSFFLAEERNGKDNVWCSSLIDSKNKAPILQRAFRVLRGGYNIVPKSIGFTIKNNN